MDIISQQQDAATEFSTKWDAQEIPGWEEISAAKSQPNVNGSEGIWCAACKYYFVITKKNVHAHSLLGQKQYSKQTVYDAHLSSKKHIKATAKQASGGAPPPNPNGASAPTQHSSSTPSHSAATTRLRNCARLTHLATSLLVSLVPVLNETKSNVERRFSLTAREREQELIDQANPAPPPAPATTEGGAEEEEEEERIYNPLKLPLGWDGKPIPYWLYKLHGLGVEYRCEICSDHVYMGRYVSITSYLSVFLICVLQKKF